MQGLFTFYWICTLTLLLTVFQDLRNFRRKKVVFFTRGAPRGIWKILANYTLFFVVNHQIPGTTPKSNHRYLLLFFGKKWTILRNFSGKYYTHFTKMYNDTYFNILYYFYLREKNNFFSEDTQLKPTVLPNKKGFLRS